ncbi:MAG: hypothetical protein H6765_00515 [Candidatus Peribacteria bacterium]|nr:MAG: hypothetical protein H6765_00515 [Candidatus Peribacteria bacterium]
MSTSTPATAETARQYFNQLGEQIPRFPDEGSVTVVMTNNSTKLEFPTILSQAKKKLEYQNEKGQMVTILYLSIDELKALRTPFSEELEYIRYKLYAMLSSKPAPQGQRKQDIELSILKINKPGFGLCQNLACKHPQMPIGRLLCMPENGFCIACSMTKVRTVPLPDVHKLRPKPSQVY